MSVALDPLRALAASPLFRGVPESVLHAISMFAEPRLLRAGETLARQGEPAKAAWLVASGEILALGSALDTRPPNAHPDSFGPGSLVGHLDILNEGPCSTTWMARPASGVLTFEAGAFRQLAGERGPTGSAFRRALIISLSEQLRAANKALADFVVANPAAAKPPRAVLKEMAGLLQGTRAAGEK